MKKIEIIPIAKKKLLRRGISEKMVTETMTSPIQIVKGYGERRVAHRKYFVKDKEYLLRVVYEEKDESYVVVTAYLTSQIKRYWEEEK